MNNAKIALGALFLNLLLVAAWVLFCLGRIYGVSELSRQLSEPAEELENETKICHVSPFTSDCNGVRQGFVELTFITHERQHFVLRVPEAQIEVMQRDLGEAATWLKEQR